MKPSNNSDMLAVFDGIEINNEEKITARDSEFCKQQQTNLYATLDQIDKWYNFFVKEAERYTESYRLSFAANGSVKSYPPHRSDWDFPEDYAEFEFLPFEQINKLVDTRYRVICRFSNTIVRYFNQTYNLSVEYPEYKEAELPITFRPDYMTAVNKVIDYLGGRGFRESAEDDVIRRFHNNIVHDYGKRPELKGDKIVFYDVVRFDDYYIKEFKRLHMCYSSGKELEILCEGIAFAGDDSLNGNSNIIVRFDSNDVNGSEPYRIRAGEAQQMKFYRNGRIDVIFSSKATADEAFRKLRLNNLKTRNN